ncbi:LAQU0S12e02124g1_1 [Lachancea quebecensis]|uniref:Autophagy-related protein 11 n=1 Tax=Lachancea quebecensis TaxID=1654605 RepID=A0A0P1L1D9_9SACH|nr:LAQU0S12e02124g1_1 [Lachancea quebecensis]
MTGGNAVIYNAITGTCVSANIRSFLGVEDLKRFISQQLMIPIDQCFILLPYGVKLKKASFLNCRRQPERAEFYVFDRRLFSFAQDPSSVGGGVDSQQLEALLDTVTRSNNVTLIKPVTSPLLEIANVTSNLDHRKITSLLTTNMGWLSALEIDAHYFYSIIHSTISEMRNIFQCLTICTQYLKLYCYDIEKLHDSNVEFLNQITKDSSVHRWRKVFEEVLKNLNTVNDEKEERLSDFLSVEDLESHSSNFLATNKLITSKLQLLKGQIDESIDKRQHISTKLQSLKSQFEEPASNYEMESHMMERFDEMIYDLKKSTRETLEMGSDEFSPELLTTISQKILKDKNSVIPKLFTVAQSLYLQADELLAKKRLLQEQVIYVLSQTAFVQFHILGIKRALLKDCNQQLESLQELELRLSQVEDFPIFYGLRLIEQLRRYNWFGQVEKLDRSMRQEFQAIGETEEKYRRRWDEAFGQLALISNMTNADLIGFKDFPTSNSKRCSSSELAATVVTTESIERYLVQLSQRGVAADSIALLKKNLVSANRISILSNQSSNFTFLDWNNGKPGESDVIKGYQVRIRKLEALLHDSKFSNINAWPSGVINNTMVTAFGNNASPVNTKINMLLSGEKETSSYIQEDSAKEIARLKRELGNQKEETALFREESKKMRTQLVDLEDEGNAYHETLEALNQEISKLTLEREQKKLAQDELLIKIKGETESVSKLNTALVNELDSWKDKCGKLSELNDGLSVRIAHQEDTSKKEKLSLEGKLLELREELASLKSANEALVSDQISLKSSNGGDWLKAFNNEMQSKLFEIFSSDVYILENIGLLLSQLDESHFQITRVKGLRKGQVQSELDESTFESKALPISIKSNVFQAVKSAHEASVLSGDADSQKEFLASIDKLFENGLYEASVIKRFKDIEALAKKLTKENKFKRGLLETYQREKITIRNFQVGDMALFLPTQDVPDSVTSSVSSLTSSFSSVDLSTPPPLGANSSHAANSHSKGKKLIDGTRPWAAFTAFDDSTRYLLRDNEKFTLDRDWFVGKITSVERSAPSETSPGTYKLPKGTNWVQVTADFVTAKNF